MKKVFISVLSFVISAAVLACPDLSGVYDCSETSFGGTTYTMEITQNGNTYTTVVDGMAGQVLIADGVPRDLAGATTTIYCTGNALVVDMSGSATIDGNPIDFHTVSTMSRSGSTLTNEIKMTSFGQTQTITTTCNEL